MDYLINMHTKARSLAVNCFFHVPRTGKLFKKIKVNTNQKERKRVRSSVSVCTEGSFSGSGVLADVIASVPGPAPGAGDPAGSSVLCIQQSASQPHPVSCPETRASRIQSLKSENTEKGQGWFYSYFRGNPWTQLHGALVPAECLNIYFWLWDSKK